jgi:hypothetical protein
MKTRHVSEVEAIDIALGERGSSAMAAHVADCPQCAERVAAVRAARDLVDEDEVPDPGDLFWRTQLSRIMAHVEDEARVRERHRRLRVVWSFAAAALVLLTTPLVLRWQQPPAPPPLLAAWEPLGPAEDDPGFALVSEVVPAMDETAQEEVAPASSATVDDLTADEQRSLLESLRAELGRQ